jgi:hypothetical protein
MTTLITLAAGVAETGHEGAGPAGFAIAGAAAAVFLLLGLVAWSYRNVANRHPNRSGANSGHH